LSEFVSANFSGNMLTLRQLSPFIQELKRRFKTLPRNKGVTGEFKTICGHRSFKSWCLGVLRRTDRAVRYMLTTGHGNNKKKTAETLSALLIRTIEYVKRQRLDKKTKTAVLKILKKRLDEEQHAERNLECSAARLQENAC
jgi:hypothetical protein